MYKHILLAADGSENSLRAADEAIKVASLVEDSQIEIIYIIDFDDIKADVLHSGSKVELDHTRRKHLIPFEEKMKAHGVNYKTTVFNGYPGQKIVEYANDQAVDMLVIGSRGLNTFQEMFVGSVSHKVFKRANSPVLIVK